MNLRILKSSTSKSLNSCLEAYQRLRQSSMIPTRNPVGCTFWPMAQRPFGVTLETGRRRAWVARPTGNDRLSVFTVATLERLQVGQADLDVRAATADHVRHAPGAGHQPLEHRAAVPPRVDDHQVADVAGAAVLGVGHGAL